VVIWAHPYIESSWFRNVRSQFSVGHFSKSENSRIAAGWVPSVIFPLSSELLARSREIRRLRVIAGAVLDDQLTRLYSEAVEQLEGSRRSAVEDSAYIAVSVGVSLGAVEVSIAARGQNRGEGVSVGEAVERLVNTGGRDATRNLRTVGRAIFPRRSIQIAVRVQNQGSQRATGVGGDEVVDVSQNSSGSCAVDETGVIGSAELAGAVKVAVHGQSESAIAAIDPGAGEAGHQGLDSGWGDLEYAARSVSTTGLAGAVEVAVLTLSAADPKESRRRSCPPEMCKERLAKESGQGSGWPRQRWRR
jgi:hypothetical protein